MVKIIPNKNEQNSYLLSTAPDGVKPITLLGLLVWNSPVYVDDMSTQIAKFINEFGNRFIFKQANVKTGDNWPIPLHGKLKEIRYWEDDKHTYYLLEGFDQLVTIMNVLWNWDLDDIIIPIEQDAEPEKEFSYYLQESTVSFSATLDFEVDIRTEKYRYKELLAIAEKVNKRQKEIANE